MVNSTVLEKQSGFFGNTRSQLRKRTLLFRYLAIINVMLGVWYLQWRILNTINFSAWWFSIPLLLAEIYSFFGGVLFTIGLWRPLERQVRSFDRLFPRMPAEQWPTVDVFITCYNEPAELVEQTVKASLGLHYIPRKLRVYILDDGNSPDMRKMVERLCQEDLQSRSMQLAAQRLYRDLNRLSKRLKQLQTLEPNIADAETFLNFYSREPENFKSNALRSSKMLMGKMQSRWLKNIREVMYILNGGEDTLTDNLATEIKRVQAAMVKKEAEIAELGRCRYIARPKPAGRPHHAKAGNINYAMFSGETSGQFILTLDADHIPKPQFLKRVLPYFYTYNLFNDRYDDNRIAFVQTPQDFYNLPNDDPFGHRAGLFYGPIQQGKDGLNSAFYTGTNAIIRREAIITVGLQNFSKLMMENEDRLDEFELIGGMSISSITEDMNTAMRLHAAGWKSVYHNEVLAEGLAPDDLSSTLKQRLRWAQGTIQVLTQENPLTKSGLSFRQRLQYFGTMYSYFSGFATLIYLLSPIVYFVTGIVPMKSMGFIFAMHFIPVFLANRMTFLSIAWGIPAREIWRSEQFAIALFPLFIQSVVTVFMRISLRFQVTPKERQDGIYLHLIKGQILIICLTLIGIALGGIKIAFGMSHDLPAYLVNCAWSAYNLMLLFSIVRAAIWKPKTSHKVSKVDLNLRKVEL